MGKARVKIGSELLCGMFDFPEGTDIFHAKFDAERGVVTLFVTHKDLPDKHEAGLPVEIAPGYSSDLCRACMRNTVRFTAWNVPADMEKQL